MEGVERLSEKAPGFIFTRDQKAKTVYEKVTQNAYLVDTLPSA